MYVDQDLTREIIGAAIEVHRVLGPGLLESAYQVCLCHELRTRKLNIMCEVPLPIHYKDIRLECSYRIDFCVENRVVVELKSVDAITDLYKAQLLTYLRISRKKIGLLLNFNVPVLKDGIVRLIL